MTDIDAIRARHVDKYLRDARQVEFCTYCLQEWPCDAATVLAALDEQRFPDREAQASQREELTRCWAIVDHQTPQLEAARMYWMPSTADWRPTMPDPLAEAVFECCTNAGTTEHADHIRQRLAEQGYVILNAETLAAALHTVCPTENYGMVGPDCQEYAAAIIAAVREASDA